MNQHLPPSNVRELTIARPKPSHSYFVVMVDYGPSYIGKKGPSGFEAVVDPEITRREVVSRLASGEYQRVVFIHHVADGLVEDVTGELIDESEELARERA